MTMAVTESPGMPKTIAGIQAPASEAELAAQASAMQSVDPRPYNSGRLLKRLEIKGVLLPELTHHVGLGTFRPVEVEDLSKHKMDSEQYILPQSTADVVNDALANKRRVCAVGTTTVRTLESSLTTGGRVTGNTGWTNKFIFPPYEIQIPDSMITNFHPPGSTLLMMNSAMVGHELAMHAINEAIKEKYRFLAFGDAMLII